MTGTLVCATRFALLSVLTATAGCGSDDDGSGGGATNTEGARCRLEITLSGSETYESDLGDPMSCITAYTLTPGAYVGYGSANSGDVGSIALRFPGVEPGEPATGIELPVEVHLVDGAEFSPTGCTADVTENTFSETTEGGDVYRVAGDGSCAGPGVVDDRSISVVGTFRFIAPIRWQN